MLKKLRIKKGKKEELIGFENVMTVGASQSAQGILAIFELLQMLVTAIFYREWS